MPESIHFKIDTTEFEATFAEYMKLTSRDLATAINTKLYYIARRAVRETPLTEREKIYADLDKLILAKRHTGRQAGKSGMVKRGIAIVQRRGTVAQSKSNYFKSRRAIYSQLLGSHLRQKLSRGGGGILSIAKAARQLQGARLRSRAYLKSGWLGAVKALEPLADRRNQPDMGPPPKKFGQYKGRAQPAVAPASPAGPIFGLISNTIGQLGKRVFKQSRALKKFGEPALQRAVDAEARSMVEYMGDKMYQTASKLGISARR